MRTLTILLFFIAIATNSNAQLDRHKIKHVRVYESADSIIKSLYEKGVDTLIAMHRVWAWEKQKNYDHDEELYSSLILWAEKGKFYYQRISEYAIYSPIREYRMDGLVLFLFKYYFINQAEIDLNPIPLKLLSNSDEGKSMKELVYAGGDFNVLSYRMGKSVKQMAWYTPNLRLDDSPSEYEIFDLKSYIWSQLIEREFRKALNIYWNSENIKIENINKISDFLGGMEGELKKWKEAADFYKKVHQYERQEILIPKGYLGLIAIVQEQPCGKKVSIKNGVRIIKIPNNGNLIVDKNYISYFQEYKLDSEKSKTSAFYVKGAVREPIAILTEKSEPSGFGLSVLGEFTKKINSKPYEFIVMYVGSRQEANNVLDRQILYNDKLPELLMNCNTK